MLYALYTKCIACTSASDERDECAGELLGAGCTRGFTVQRMRTRNFRPHNRTMHQTLNCNATRCVPFAHFPDQFGAEIAASYTQRNTQRNSASNPSNNPEKCRHSRWPTEFRCSPCRSIVNNCNGARLEVTNARVVVEARG